MIIVFYYINYELIIDYCDLKQETTHKAINNHIEHLNLHKKKKVSTISLFRSNL
jgi:hypothetical protein